MFSLCSYFEGELGYKGGKKESESLGKEISRRSMIFIRRLKKSNYRRLSSIDYNEFHYVTLLDFPFCLV